MTSITRTPLPTYSPAPKPLAAAPTSWLQATIRRSIDDFEMLVLVGAATSGTGNADSNVITASPLAHGATLNGAGGADNLFGSAFVDIINGGAGADNDVMFGGTGADAFQFNAPNFGTDTISDFVTTAVSAGNHDLINLQGTGVANFAALNISYSVAGATIDTGVGTIFLTGITVRPAEQRFRFLILEDGIWRWLARPSHHLGRCRPPPPGAKSQPASF